MILEEHRHKNAPTEGPHTGTCVSVRGYAGRWPCPPDGSGQTRSWSPPRDGRSPAEWSVPGPGGQLLGE